MFQSPPRLNPMPAEEMSKPLIDACFFSEILLSVPSYRHYYKLQKEDICMVNQLLNFATTTPALDEQGTYLWPTTIKQLDPIL